MKLTRIIQLASVPTLAMAALAYKADTVYAQSGCNSGGHGSDYCADPCGCEVSCIPGYYACCWGDQGCHCICVPNN